MTPLAIRTDATVRVFPSVSFPPVALSGVKLAEPTIAFADRCHARMELNAREIIQIDLASGGAMRGLAVPTSLLTERVRRIQRAGNRDINVRLRECETEIIGLYRRYVERVIVANLTWYGADIEATFGPVLAMFRAKSGVERAIADSIVSRFFLKSRVWDEFRDNLRESFALERKLASRAGSTSRAAARRAAIEPLLRAENLSLSGWAKKAGIDAKLPANYLACKTDLRREKREALAAVLGKNPDEVFPD
jgi:hypothetical protein